jgi:ATP-dependent exoDNAse (exonuclease V) beta subunit
MLRDRHARNPQTISQLAADIRQAAPEAEAPPAEFGNVVRLMTMHKAKGLEFPVVFLPFLHKGRSYGFPVISYSHQGGLGVKWRNPVDSDGVGDAFWRANREAAQGAQDAEENRLLYVGCTRAQEHLVTSWSVTGNERPAWSGLVARQLCIDLSVATNEVSRQDGIRVFTTDRKPPVTIGHSSRNATPLLHILDSPAMTDEADSVASVTDISRFVECPRKYYLAGYLKQKKRSRTMLRRLLEEDFPADDGKWSASEIGVQVHALLAGQPLQHAAEEAILLADIFRSSDLYRRLSRATRKEHEWDFLMDLGGIVLRGQIDLWFEHKGELIVVDYKTDRDPDSLAISGHSLQLQIYALALERQLRRVPDRAVLFFLRESRQHEVDLSPLALGAAFEACHNFRAAQASVTFPVSPGTHCRRCDFVGGLCPVGLNVSDVAGSPVAVKSLRN